MGKLLKAFLKFNFKFIFMAKFDIIPDFRKYIQLINIIKGFL